MKTARGEWKEVMLVVCIAIPAMVLFVSPFFYLLLAAFHWLKLGFWYQGDVCTLPITKSLFDSCVSRTAYVGIDQIMDWLYQHPFSFLVVFGWISGGVLWALATRISESAWYRAG